MPTGIGIIKAVQRSVILCLSICNKVEAKLSHTERNELPREIRDIKEGIDRVHFLSAFSKTKAAKFVQSM